MSPEKRRIRPRIGDVLEIDTPKGLGYLQYVRKERDNGAMIRVLPGVYATRPDVAALVDGPTSYCVFFPVGAAANRGVVRIIDTFPIPEHAQLFPLMRAPGWLLRPGWRPERPIWWLWDGERSWRVSNLDDAALHASPKEHWNDTILAKRIAEGWSPADDPYH